jgi:transposase
MDSSNRLTSLASIFLEPCSATHRQYEALRAYYVEGLPSAEAARKFGYTPGSFRVLCHQFRQDPHREFFLPAGQRGERTPRPNRDKLREQVVALRKQNLSVYDISKALKKEGDGRSPVAIWQILNEEGFARLPRRRDDERPAATKPQVAAVADATQFDLGPRRFRTQFGGLFLFLPYLAEIGFDGIMGKAKLPGSKKVTAGCAMRSLLGLKLFGSARHSHLMAHVFDEGLGLFAGLNVIPKRSFLTEYSCRIDPRCYPKLMRRWFEAVGALGLERGVSFDLDFHTIPFHGEDALIEKHYVSKRSRRQKGVLAFLAQDVDKRVFCYANPEIRKGEENDEILSFIKFWKKHTGRLPEELVFDSKVTTYANLNRLNQAHIRFITLRRRSRKMLDEIAKEPASAWRQIELAGVSRAYRTPKILDRKITLSNYEGPLRQLTVANLGHDEPTLLLTNQMRRSAKKLIERYAQRMLIENGIADGIDFFHMDALSSAVAMKVNCDLQLTLMASSLYRLLGARIGNGYASAKSRHIFRDFVEAAAYVTISERDVTVHFGKRAHNPLLLAAGFAKTDVSIPWWGRRRLRFVFG